MLNRPGVVIAEHLADAVEHATRRRLDKLELASPPRLDVSVRAGKDVPTGAEE